MIVSIVFSTFLLISTANAGFRITLEKDVLLKNVNPLPNEITFHIYESETATTPLASQTFPREDWTADYDFSRFVTPGNGKKIARFRVEFTNTDALTKDVKELWLEIEWDGESKGPRERIKNATWALFAQMCYGYNNVIVVSTDGNGDFTDPRDAVNAIGDPSGSYPNPASATNPYLVKIMPGVYDIGNSFLQMKEYVDIEGSGENTTKITGNITLYYSGVVRGADNAEIRFLTVENTGSGTYALAMYNDNASPKITNVTAKSSGGAYNRGINNVSSSPTMINVTAIASGGDSSYAVFNSYSSSPTMINLTATASGGSNTFGINNGEESSPTMISSTVTASGGTNYNRGVFNANSSPTMINVTVTASGGTYNYGVDNQASGYGTVKIDHSVITGSSAAINNTSGFTNYVGNTKLEGGAVSGGGTTICAGVYDENYTFYANTCP
jgi:hypothetical protein